LFQVDGRGKQRRILQKGGQLAIVQPQELLEDQAGKELWQRELLGAIAMSVSSQSLLTQGVGDLQEEFGGLTRLRHVLRYQQPLNHA
jgi:hypothetical protein